MKNSFSSNTEVISFSISNLLTKDLQRLLVSSVRGTTNTSTYSIENDKVVKDYSFDKAREIVVQIVNERENMLTEFAMQYGFIWENGDTLILPNNMDITPKQRSLLSSIDGVEFSNVVNRPIFLKTSIKFKPVDMNINLDETFFNKLFESQWRI